MCVALPAMVNREYHYVVSAASTGLLCSEDHIMIFTVNHSQKGHAHDRTYPGSLSLLPFAFQYLAYISRVRA